jgi:2-amino-4-hydroxy-6-hydroxymethyldihydropteridine diphosphokinase
MKYSPCSPVIAYVGLGSNLAEPAAQITSARSALVNVDGVRELAFSSLYHSLPMGPQDQPDYVNAVMCVETDLLPFDFLHCLQKVEHEHGRIRKGERWGARTLDLDILMYGDQEIDEPDLIVPHLGIGERSFVLYPLFEIAPTLFIPGKGVISDMVEKCPLAGLKRLN